MSKQVIAVDIDDVLSLSAEGFARFSKERWGSRKLADDYSEDWSKFWEVSLEEAIKRADELHKVGLFGTYQPVPQALSVLRSLKNRYDLIVVTSRRLSLKQETDAWLARNFSNIFSAVHYAGFYDRDLSTTDIKRALSRHKADLCLELGANYLIDDQLKHCVGAAKSGMQALLFGQYQWNRIGEKLPNVTKVHTWKDVQDYFNASR